MKIPPKSRVDVSNWMLLEQVLTWWRHLVACLWKPWTYFLAQPRPSKWSAKWTHFASLFCLLLPLGLPGRYGARSRPIVVSSGFWYSPGHAAVGDAICIALLHRHGYWNGQQRRYICLLLPSLLFDQSVAKRPWYGPFKLMPSYYINLSGVISLFVSYWLPPLKMEAVLATIFPGGRARFWQHTEVSIN